MHPTSSPNDPIVACGCTVYSQPKQIDSVHVGCKIVWGNTLREGGMGWRSSNSLPWYVEPTMREKGEISSINTKGKEDNQGGFLFCRRRAGEIFGRPQVAMKKRACTLEDWKHTTYLAGVSSPHRLARTWCCRRYLELSSPSREAPEPPGKRDPTWLLFEAANRSRIHWKEKERRKKIKIFLPFPVTCHCQEVRLEHCWEEALYWSLATLLSSATAKVRSCQGDEVALSPWLPSSGRSVLEKRTT